MWGNCDVTYQLSDIGKAAWSFQALEFSSVHVDAVVSWVVLWEDYTRSGMWCIYKHLVHRS